MYLALLHGRDGWKRPPISVRINLRKNAVLIRDVSRQSLSIQVALLILVAALASLGARSHSFLVSQVVLGTFLDLSLLVGVVLLVPLVGLGIAFGTAILISLVRTCRHRCLLRALALLG